MGALLLVAGLLAGCERKPDFDARYADASKQIEQRAREIDASIAASGTPATEGAEPKRPE